MRLFILKYHITWFDYSFFIFIFLVTVMHDAVPLFLYSISTEQSRALLVVQTDIYSYSNSISLCSLELSLNQRNQYYIHACLTKYNWLKNYFLKLFIDKEKNIIDFWTIFFYISYKNCIKTFLKWSINKYFKDIC